MTGSMPGDNKAVVCSTCGFRLAPRRLGEAMCCCPLTDELDRCTCPNLDAMEGHADPACPFYAPTLAERRKR